MARAKIKLSSKGIAAALKSPGFHAATKSAAESVADNVRSQGITVGAMTGSGEIPLPVEVSMTTTDRAHANVTIAHPAGLPVQAKYGALTKAAGQAGLDVNGGGS